MIRSLSMKFVVFFLCVLSFNQCKPIKQIEHNSTNRNIFNDIFLEVKHYLASNYYNDKSNKKIEVYIEPVDSNFSEEPLFSNFFYNEITDEFNKANQIEIVHKDDAKLEFILSITIIKNEKQVSVLTNVVDAKKNVIIYSLTKKCDTNDKIFEDYYLNKNFYEQLLNDEIRRQKEQENKKEAASLYVQAVSLGSSWEEEDKYYLYNYRNRLGDVSDSYIVKDESGNSGYYPTNITCEILEKQYKTNADGLIFEGKVPPGTTCIKASFQGAEWDAYNTQELLEKKIEKIFCIKLGENDEVRVDLYCKYNGKKQAIAIKAYRVKGILKEIKMKTKEFPIEVYY